MDTRKTVFFSLGLTAVLAAAILYGIGPNSVHAATSAGAAPPKAIERLVLEKAPKAAPQVAFGDVAGKRHAVADFKGHYVLLNLWATWCAPCVSELPALARLSAAVPGLKVIAVDVGRDKAAAADAFLKSHNAAGLGTFVDNDIMMIRAFGAYGLPATVLIDPSGKVIAKAQGPAEWSAPAAVAYFKSLTAS